MPDFASLWQDARAWLNGALTADNVAAVLGAVTSAYLGNLPLKAGATIAAVIAGAIGAYFSTSLIVVLFPGMVKASAPIGYFAGLLFLKLAAGVMLRFDRFKRGEIGMRDVVNEVAGGLPHPGGADESAH